MAAHNFASSFLGLKASEKQVAPALWSLVGLAVELITDLITGLCRPPGELRVIQLRAGRQLVLPRY